MLMAYDRAAGESVGDSEPVSVELDENGEVHLMLWDGRLLAFDRQELHKALTAPDQQEQAA